MTGHGDFAASFRDATRRQAAAFGAQLVQLGCWPPTTDGAAVEPRSAYRALDRVREAIEREAGALLASHSSADWLRGLRQLPRAAFVAPGEPPAVGVMHSRTAEALSDLAPRQTGFPSSAAPGAGPEPDLLALVDLVAMAVLLYRVHVGLRLAGKDVALWCTDDLRLEAGWTASQQAAVALYDSRTESGDTPFAAVAGLPLGEVVADLDVVRELDVLLAVPRPLGQGDLRTMEPWGRPDVQVAHNIGSYDLQQLADAMQGVKAGSSAVVPAPVRAVAVLLRVVRLIFDEQMVEAMYALLAHGMFESDSPAGLGSYIDRTFDFQSKLFPDSAPLSAEGWLHAIVDTSLVGSAWPVTPGPPIRLDERSLILDLVACTSLLNDRLGALTSDDGLVTQRGGMFESSVQALVDRSPWGEVPEDVRALRGQQLQDATGQYVTDLDVIGFRDGRLLLIDCLSKVKSPGRHLMGDRAALLTDGRRVELKVSGPSHQPERGWQGKCARVVGQRGRNFDLTDYGEALCVVVTPVPIYVEAAFVGRSRAGAAEEVAEGLVAAASLGELVRWLSD